MRQTTATSPRCCVLTPAYNAEDTLPRAIDSVLAQDEQDWRMVIVDDGSSDATLEVASRYAGADSRLEVIHQCNAGAAAARNTGLSACAACEYVTLLDADDVLEPNYLSSMRSFSTHDPGYDIYSCYAYTFDEVGRTGLFQPQWHLPHAYSVGIEEMLDGNPIYVSATVRVESVRRVGGFRADRYAEDYDLWVRMLSAGATNRVNPHVLAGYSTTEGKSANRSAELTSVVQTLESSRLDILSAGVGEDRLREAIGRFEALRIRWESEELARSGDMSGLAQIGRQARQAYTSESRFLLALLLTRVWPSMYMRVVAERRARQPLGLDRS